jgi:hypothetical protein
MGLHVQSFILKLCRAALSAQEFPFKIGPPTEEWFTLMIDNAFALSIIRVNHSSFQKPLVLQMLTRFDISENCCEGHQIMAFSGSLLRSRPSQDRVVIPNPAVIAEGSYRAGIGVEKSRATSMR